MGIMRIWARTDVCQISVVSARIIDFRASRSEGALSRVVHGLNREHECLKCSAGDHKKVGRGGGASSGRN